MDIWELTAREQIRDLLARYTWAGDRGQVDAMAALFTANGVLDVGDHGGRWVGPPAIAAGLRAVVERFARAAAATDGGPSSVDTVGALRHHVSSVLIQEVSGSGAAVRSCFAVYGPAGLDHWGRYIDRLKLEIGRWRFAERVVVVDGAAAGSRGVTRR